MRQFILKCLLISCCFLLLDTAAFCQDTSLNNSKKDTLVYRPQQDVWKWGVFYYDTADKRLFPPKANGLGWTVNFANPASIAAMAFLLIVIIGIGLGLKKRTGKEK